jgi:hypothetical protein
MMLEVNITFDERRMYYMNRKPWGDDAEEDSNIFATRGIMTYAFLRSKDGDGAYALSALIHPTCQPRIWPKWPTFCLTELALEAETLTINTSFILCG